MKSVQINRAAFLAGTAATLGVVLPESGESAPTAMSGTSVAPPQRLLDQLMAGNKRFLNNDFPSILSVAQKREALVESQAPFAVILSCSDSRVIPNLVFVQGMGDLFVARVAGNYPDDLVIASIEYAVEHLASRLIVVLGHQHCGAVAAVYSAIAEKKPLHPHLSTIEELLAPGIAPVLQSNGTVDEAVHANVRAAVAKLKATGPVLSKGVESGHLLIAGGYYHLGTGEVTLVD